MQRVPGTDNPLYFYALPTFRQAKRVAWKPLKKLIPPQWIKKISETELIIETVFGSELHVVGMDKPQRIEGTQWCGGVIDECSDQRPGVFDLSVRPALTEYNGWCWRIGVPKRYGQGALDFKAAWDLGNTGLDPDIESYHWDSETIVDPIELDRIKATMDERDYNEQYKASWEKASGAIFYSFDEKKHINDQCTFNPSLPIIVGSDFNVNPMCWVLCHLTANGLFAFDELVVRNTNTEETLVELSRRYGNHSPGYRFFGDASGKARKTSASSSDYIQIANCELFTNKEMYYLKGNPPLVNRFASCNALLKNAKGEVRFQMNPKCKRLIADLNHRSYKEQSREPNDAGDMGHMSDAWGYIVYRLFPLKIVDDNPSPIILHS